MKNSGWKFDKFSSLIVYFYETGELNGSNFTKIPLRSNAILNNETNDKYYFPWSILASLHPCNDNHLKRVSKFKQNFNELNINGFDLINGFDFFNEFICGFVPKVNELNNLSLNMFELNIYLDQNKWRHK